MQTPPSAEGGALRSQDLRSSGDPVGLDGTVIRIDPATGAALPSNPLFGDPDPNARRIVAQGLRNPFRMTTRPGTSEIWVGDVGWSTWEEINRIGSTSTVTNFGWPCYEGSGRQSSYDNLNLTLCENLFAEAGAVPRRSIRTTTPRRSCPDEACGTGSSTITGLAFYGEGAYPADYHGALFFADYARGCVWTMFPGAGGEPDPSNRQTFISGAETPVQLTTGPGGDLFYVDIVGGRVHRIQYSTPAAVLVADPVSGDAPLTVSFDATGSSHPDPAETLTYSWDLDGDGNFGDSTALQPTHTYETAGSYTVRLRVTDSHGGTDTESVVIDVGNSAPGSDDPLSGRRNHVESRRPPVLLRIRHGCRGRRPSEFEPLLDAAPPSLPRQLSRPRHSDVRGRRQRHVRRRGPRVPLAPGASPDGHGLSRAGGDGERAPVPPDDDRDSRVEPAGPPDPVLQRRGAGPVRPHGDRGLDQLHRNRVASDAGDRQLGVRVVVGRRGPEPQRDRGTRSADVHGDVRPPAAPLLRLDRSRTPWPAAPPRRAPSCSRGRLRAPAPRSLWPARTPGVVSVPGSVLIPAGQTSGTFPVTTAPVGSSTPVTVNASYAAGNLGTTLTVTGNVPPVVTNPGNQTGLEGSTVNLPISASDPNGDVLT